MSVEPQNECNNAELPRCPLSDAAGHSGRPATGSGTTG